MENEEKILREKVGQDNPFRVPEGYFAQLTDQVMKQVPVRQQKVRIIPFRTWFYAAASILLATLMGLTFYFHHEDEKQQQQIAVSTETNTDDTYIDEMADYAMIDNSEIFACLSDN